MSRKKRNGRSRGKQPKKVLPEVTGRVQMTREGYAFIIIEGEEDDVGREKPPDLTEDLGVVDQDGMGAATGSRFLYGRIHALTSFSASVSR